MTNRQPARTRRRGAFSLVELLVVIAIVVVLAGLLLPGVRLAKDLSLTEKCASNLRQLNVFILQFENDNDGLMPGVGQGGSGSVCWADIINTEVLADEKVAFFRLNYGRGASLNCPAYPSPPGDFHRSVVYNQDAAGRTWDWQAKTSLYGKVVDPPSLKNPAYASWVFYALGVPRTRFSDPSGKALLMDAYATVDYFTAPGFLAFRHRGGSVATVCFVDGHVGTVVKASPEAAALGCAY